MLALNNDEGELSLPVWSDRQRLKEFLMARHAEKTFHLIEFPVERFKETFIAEGKVAEFQINPGGAGKGVLTLSAQEFEGKLETIGRG